MLYNTKNDSFDTSKFDYKHVGVKYISIHVKPGEFETGKQILYAEAKKFLNEEKCNASCHFEMTHENIVEWSYDLDHNAYPVVQYMLMTASFDYGILTPKNDSETK